MTQTETMLGRLRFFSLAAAIIVASSSCGSSAPTAPTRLSSPSLIQASADTIGQCLGGFHGAVCQNAAAFPSAIADVPGPPRNLRFQVTPTPSGSWLVNLTWELPAGGAAPQSVIVQAGSAPGQSDFANVDLGDARTTIGAVVSVSVPTTYYVRLRARNQDGVGAASNEVVVTLAPCVLPQAVTGLRAAVSGVTLTLTWDSAGTSVQSYVIEVGSTSGTSNVAVLDTGSTATSFSTTAPNGTYYIRVRARGSCGDGAASNEVVVTISTPPGTYIGPFSGQVTLTVSSSGGPNPTPIVCTFTYALAGTITITLEQRSDGIGTANVDATRTQIGFGGSNQCSPSGPGAEVSFRDGAVTGTTSNLAFSRQFVDTSTSWRVATTSFAFSGSLSGGVISGTATYTHQGGGTNPAGPTRVTESGSATFPVTLR